MKIRLLLPALVLIAQVVDGGRFDLPKENQRRREDEHLHPQHLLTEDVYPVRRDERRNRRGQTVDEEREVQNVPRQAQLAFAHRDSLTAFPAPGSLLYYGGKRSDPVLDGRKAARFWERVVEHTGEVLEDLVARWNREGMPATQRRRVVPERARRGANGRTTEAGPPRSAREKK